MSYQEHNRQTYYNVFRASLSEKNFNDLAGAIKSVCGINLPPSKKMLLEGRLRKRLRHLGMNSFQEYCRYLFEQDGFSVERQSIIDLVTTNKTDFFRESRQFEFLSQYILPEIQQLSPPGRNQRLTAWSAGCSTGEEAYTLVMVIKEFVESNQALDFSVFATDISTEVLTKAKVGVYPHEGIEMMPITLRKKYLLKNKKKNLIRVAPEVRKHAHFRYLNLLDTSYEFEQLFHLVFCRNVIIYFTKDSQKKIIENIYRHILPGGYLFMGHSETLSGLNLPLEHITTNIYRKRQ